MGMSTHINHITCGKNQIRTLLCTTVQSTHLPQKEILNQLNKIIGNLPEFPRWIRRDCRSYFDGMFDYFKKDKTVFLYKVKGNFYTTSHYKEEVLPVWHELPNKKWPLLQGCGGIYYKYTHELFFK